MPKNFLFLVAVTSVENLPTLKQIIFADKIQHLSFFVKKFGRIQLNSKLKKLFKKDSAYYLSIPLKIMTRIKILSEFLREHLTPFEENSELLEKISLVDNVPQKIHEDVYIDGKNFIFSGIENGFYKIYLPGVENDWKSFQENFRQDKKMPLITLILLIPRNFKTSLTLRGCIHKKKVL